MTKLNLDQAIINTSRLYAKDIAKQTQEFIDLHTTVSVERAVLRLLGVDGINAYDVPLVNSIIDHIKHKCHLEKGVCHYLSYALKDYQLSPQEIAEKIERKEIDLSVYNEKPLSLHMDLLMPYFFEIRKKIDEMKSIRRQKMSKEYNRQKPYLYVIVATGNIYEDIKQAVAAAEQGADIIAVIRSTGQSLLDYVPFGPTTEGFGGTYATQANFKLMRKALDDVSKKLDRYVRLVNYASGLCMPEIAAIGAIERLDMMLNDSLYGIIFRDINMKRTFIDQYFSRVLSAYSEITINTGEDNYLTTTDAFEHAHTVLASQFINEQFAKLAYMKDHLIGLGHAYEIDPNIENSFLYELAQAQLSRDIFPLAPLKYMPPTKHITGNIFKATIMNSLFNIITVTTHQSIHLLGMMTEAIHTPFLSDRALAIENATYIQKAFSSFGDEISFKPNGIIENRAQEVLIKAHDLLKTIHEEGIFETLNKGRFADIKRKPNQGKGLEGVLVKDSIYQNPILDYLINQLKEEN